MTGEPPGAPENQQLASQLTVEASRLVATLFFAPGYGNDSIE
jgi:hypothetical protein